MSKKHNPSVGHESLAKGDSSVGYISMALMASGKKVLIPLTYNSRYDLLIDEDGKYTRVQCKTGRVIQDGSILAFEVCSKNNKGERKDYIGQVDVFAIHHNKKVYLVPAGKNKVGVWLRLKKPKGSFNNEDKPIRMAKDFELGI
jgi:hypothetical protein